MSKVVITYNDALQDTALKTQILILGSCRFAYFERPKTYQFYQKNNTFRSDRYTDYPDNTTFFI